MIHDPLFAHLSATERQGLAASPFGRLLPGEKVVDLFCGGGGWGEGSKQLGVMVDYAINHSKLAIEIHKANNPDCIHHQGDAWRVRPRAVVGDEKIILFASAACTTVSRAKGTAPIGKRVHMLGWCVARWIEEKEPRTVDIENVPEWEGWGPLIPKRASRGRFYWQRAVASAKKPKWTMTTGPRTGTPEARAYRERMKSRGYAVRAVMVQDPERKGHHFRRWWRYCESLGYHIEKRIDDAPNHGNGSRRKRLFIKMRRDGMPICWPAPTHGPIGSGLKPYRTAAECIDFNDLGTSIFERDKDLAEKTLERIVDGVFKLVVNDPKPFLLRVTQTGGGSMGGQVFRTDGPMPTQTTRQDIAMATPILAANGWGEREGQAARVHKVTDLLGTCVNGIKQAVVTPILLGAGGSTYAAKPTGVDRPLNTVKCDNRQALVAPILIKNYTGMNGARIDEPMGTVTRIDHHSLAVPLLTYYRHGGGQCSDVREPMGAVTAGGNHAMLVAALLTEYYGSGSGKSLKRIDQPLGAVTTLDRHGLVVVRLEVGKGVFWDMTIVDILFRMLRPRELAAAMSFRPDMIWPRSQRDTVQLIGNAVAPCQARELVSATFPGYEVRRVA